MTAPAVSRGTPPRPVTILDDVLLELVDVGDNVRIDPGELDELAASIAELGVLDPVKVTTQPDGRYRLVWGQRRVIASRMAGKLRIPAIVEPASDIDLKGGRRSIEQLTENLQRKDLNPIEEAVALREVLDGDKALNQELLAKRLGRSRPWVSNTLGLLEAPKAIQASVREGKLSASHVNAIRGLPTEVQERLATAAIKEQVSAHELERRAKWDREDLTRQERDRGRLEKIAKSAIDSLEKVAAKDALIVLNAGLVANAIKKAGWKRVQVGGRWDLDLVANAGECGCATWLVDFDSYGSKPEAKVKPACADKAHREARQAAQTEEWDRDHAERAARNDALEATRLADRKVIVAAIRPALVALPDELRRAILMSIAGSDHYMMLALQGRHGGSTTTTESRATWAMIAGLTPPEALDELAIAIASDVTPESWQAERSAGARALLLALAPTSVDADPAPAKAIRKPRTNGGADAPPFTPAQAAAAAADLEAEGLT